MTLYIPTTYQMGSPSLYGFLDLIALLLARKNPKIPANKEHQSKTFH